MINNPQSVTEARELAGPLIEKTRLGKLRWEQTTKSDFFAFVGGGYGFTVYELEADGFGLLMQDEGKNEMLRVELEKPLYGWVDPSEEDLFKKLSALHELARRSALDVDRKVVQVKELISQL